MDLLSLNDEPLYFEAALEGGAAQLLEQAADCIGDPEAEHYLLSAQQQAPESLEVLVALFRYYLYHKQFDAALSTSREARRMVSMQLKLPVAWSEVSTEMLFSQGVTPRVRFYLFTLKGEGYVLLRQGQITEARKVLEWVKDRDKHDRIGASAMLNTLFS